MASKESKTESKKSKRKRDEKEDKRCTSGPPESDTTEAAAVHSANSWEKVDLGDDERKSKFLRLMGATKKEHHGRFVIGDNRTEHGRSKEEVEKLTDDLEEQYEQGMGLRLSGAARQHKGLGFQETNEEDGYSKADEEDPVPEEPIVTEEKSEEEEQPKKKKKKSKKDKDNKDKDNKDSCAKDDETNTRETEEKQKPAKPLLGFVKASSG